MPLPKDDRKSTSTQPHPLPSEATKPRPAAAIIASIVLLVGGSQITGVEPGTRSEAIGKKCTSGEADGDATEADDSDHYLQPAGRIRRVSYSRSPGISCHESLLSPLRMRAIYHCVWCYLCHLQYHFHRCVTILTCFIFLLPSPIYLPSMFHYFDLLQSTSFFYNMTLC